MYFDLHRHDEHSLFDGFGKPKELAQIAKELGYKALGISNHGSVSGLVQHYHACNEVGIRPVMGCEVYFIPVFNPDKYGRKYYHLNLFCKNLVGYKNLCHILSEAAMNKFYYKALVDFELLEKYSEGLICCTACIQSASSQAIVNNNVEMAVKYLKKFKSIFGDDLYIEIQPYEVDDKHTQEKLDYKLMQLGKKLNIKCILTSDSHFGRKEDLPTYLKMHEIGKTTYDVKQTYGERYMPSESEIAERFIKIYTGKLKAPRKAVYEFMDNLEEIYNKVEDNILDGLELELPKISEDGEHKLKQLVKQGLKQKGKWNKQYRDRCLYELDVIAYHGFSDYFLIVHDYVDWARKQGISVGPGRGSVCNCLVAYAIGITEVDSIRYRLDFSRFMRKEKKSLPDIDTDFETDRRQEVIDYVVNRYKGKAVQICSYGMYGIDNLINDLATVCGLKTTKDVEQEERERNKKVIADIKKYLKGCKESDGELNLEKVKEGSAYEKYNRYYDDILVHFCKMYNKIRYLGKHAAGVAVVGTDISDYTAIICRDKAKGLYSSSYDKDDLEHINCIKFDMLGLKTMSELRELEEYTGYKVTDDDLEDYKVLKSFREGKTDGVFQMEKNAPKEILSMVHCDCVDDVIAVNALNRPAPLQLKMHETYAENKLSGNIDKNNIFYQYTKETYGTILYQEQTVEVAQRVGHLSQEQSFDMLKIMKKVENLTKPEYVPIIEQMRKDFLAGCKKEHLTKEQSLSLWDSMLIYGFNRGHKQTCAVYRKLCA